MIHFPPVTPPPAETEKKEAPPRAIRSAPPHSLALYRIAFGLILILQLLGALKSASAFGVTEWLFMTGFLLMAALFTAGAWLRYTAVILAALFSLQATLLLTAGADENALTCLCEIALFIPFLLLLAWSKADRAYSHAMHITYGSWREWEEVRAFPITVFKIMISLAYLYIGAVVLWQPVWMSGMRLRSALIGSLGTGIAARLARLPIPLPFFDWSLYLTKAFMLMLPFSFWISSVRTFSIILGFLLHLAAGVLLGEWWLFAIGFGMVLFLDPNAVRIFMEKRMKGNN